jgi:hypothetical protein
MTENHEALDLNVERARIAEGLDEVWQMIVTEKEREGVDVLALVDRGLEVLKQRAELFDLYPPERVVIVENEKPDGPPPDSAVIAAIRELNWRQRAERDGD